MDRRRHSWPQFLPDGQGLLTTVTGAMASQALAVLSFKTGEWHVLVPGLQGLYVSPGYLVYHAAQDRDGQLDAVGFDVETLSVRGSTVSVLGDVFRAANGGAAFFAISQTGTLIFAPGGLARTLVQVDRQGRRTSLIGERRGFRFPRFSPDGKRVAVTVDPRPSQIWVYDLERDSRIPLTKEGHNITPLWAPDGQRVAFAGRGGVKWAAADGSSPPDVLIPWTQPDAQNASPTWWSPDGRTLIFNEQVPTTDYDIWIAPKNEKPRTLVSTSARELGAKVSPDSRWLAYFSNESGRNEVYVRPFPNVNDHKWTISTAGGWSPAWSPDGHELFYMSGSSMWTVTVETRGASFVAGKPQHLFDGPFDTTQVGNFDVSPDGTRFVMVEADPDAKPTKINVVTNWAQEVQRVVRAAH